MDLDTETPDEFSWGAYFDVTTTTVNNSGAANTRMNYVMECNGQLMLSPRCQKVGDCLPIAISKFTNLKPGEYNIAPMKNNERGTEELKHYERHTGQLFNTQFLNEGQFTNIGDQDPSLPTLILCQDYNRNQGHWLIKLDKIALSVPKIRTMLRNLKNREPISISPTPEETQLDTERHNKPVKTKKDVKRLDAFYDLETVFDPDTRMFIVYQACLLMTNPDGSTTTKVFTGKNDVVFWQLIDTMMDTGLHYNLISFNGSNFDDILLFNFLSRRKRYDIKTLPVGNSILCTTFALRSTGASIKCFDVARYLTGSLAANAKAFKCDVTKNEEYVSQHYQL